MCYIQCTGFLWWVLRGGSGGVIRFMLALLIDVDEWVLCVKCEQILSIDVCDDMENVLLIVYGKYK